MLFVETSTLLEFLFLSSLIVYFNQSVLNVNLGHILSFFIIVLLVFVAHSYYQNVINYSNESILSKLNGLSETFTPEWFYIDPDIIIILDTIKPYLISENNKEIFDNLLRRLDNFFETINEINNLNESIIVVDPPNLVSKEINYTVSDRYIDTKEYILDLKDKIRVLSELREAIIDNINSLFYNLTDNSALTEYLFVSFKQKISKFLKKHINRTKTLIKDNKYNYYEYVDLM